MSEGAVQISTETSCWPPYKNFPREYRPTVRLESVGSSGILALYSSDKTRVGCQLRVIRNIISRYVVSRNAVSLNLTLVEVYDPVEVAQGCS